MTLRYSRCQLLPAAVLMVILATASVGRAAVEASPTPEEVMPADTLRKSAETLPPWQRMLSGQDSVHVAELEEQITELREQAKYAEAIPLAEEALGIRRRVQGEDHWEFTDVVQLVGTLNYIADLPAEAQAELAEADGLQPKSDSLYEQGKYGEVISLVERQLEIRERLLAEEHPEVASSLHNLAVLLETKGDYAGAEPLHRQALAIRRKVLGEKHPVVASSLTCLAHVLWSEGDYAGAEPLYRESLAMKRELLGQEHPLVAYSLSFLASLLRDKGDYAGAEPLLRESLAMRRKLVAEEHREVAASLQRLGLLLYYKGDYAGAEPLLREALAMWRKVLGEEHPGVATILNSLAGLLERRGDYAGAETLCRESLEMRRRLLGDEHPDVATCLNNLGWVISAEGDYAGAEPLLREALAMWRKVLGEEHPDVAACLSNLAGLLESKGDYAGAEPLYRESLAILRRLVGDEHPHVAACLNSLARLLRSKGDYAGAEPLSREALAMRRELLAQEHPDVALSLGNLARLLYGKGDYAAAETAWVAAAKGFESSRLRMSAGGLERAGFATARSPLALLAACLARNGKPNPAWARLEAYMARGLLDEVSTRASRALEPEERDREESLLGQLGKLDERISVSLSADDSTGEAAAWADTLRWRRDALLAELARLQADIAAKYGVAAGETYELGRIQGTLPADAALLAWVDVKGDSHAVDPNGEHWASVVRQQGEPVWVKLPGSGDDGSWTEADNGLPRRVRETLGSGELAVEARTSEAILEQLHAQRLAPLRPHLAGVDRLIVLPAGWMAGVPVEAMTDDYAVSYAPSATMYAWLREGRRSQVPTSPRLRRASPGRKTRPKHRLRRERQGGNRCWRSATRCSSSPRNLTLRCRSRRITESCWPWSWTEATRRAAGCGPVMSCSHTGKRSLAVPTILARQSSRSQRLQKTAVGLFR